MTGRECVTTNSADLFMQSACQYYTVARFAAHAECRPVCGILFHHTVEMFLKAGLAQKRDLAVLKAMEHDLKKLWRAFKTDFPDADLKRHDGTISRVNKFEGLRYPEEIIEHGMLVSVQWSGPVAKGVVTHGDKTPKQYVVVVSDIDNLIVDVFKACSRNPIVFIGTDPAALEAISRYNNHSGFLTKR
jgi:hypothetical protein